MALARPVRLEDFAELSARAHDAETAPPSAFEEFRAHPSVSALGWPDDVVEQWLFDHASNESFLADYGHLDLTALQWHLEAIATAELVAMPTGESDRDYIDLIADDPDHWISVRCYGVHVGVREMWAVHGTWKRWPLLIDRSMCADSVGLQVIEGRTRVGILRGRHLNGDRVAERHLAWVARHRE